MSLVKQAEAAGMTQEHVNDIYALLEKQASASGHDLAAFTEEQIAEVISEVYLDSVSTEGEKTAGAEVPPASETIIPGSEVPPATEQAGSEKKAGAEVPPATSTEENVEEFVNPFDGTNEKLAAAFEMQKLAEIYDIPIEKVAAAWEEGEQAAYEYLVEMEEQQKLAELIPSDEEAEKLANMRAYDLLAACGLVEAPEREKVAALAVPEVEEWVGARAWEILETNGYNVEELLEKAPKA